jgi:hypothetical protein
MAASVQSRACAWPPAVLQPCVYFRKGETMEDMAVQPLAGTSPGLTQWQRVACTFTAPSKTFEDIQRGNRSWWVPLLLIAVASYALFAVISQKVGMEQAVENQIQLDSRAEAQVEQLSPEKRESLYQFWTEFTDGIFLAGPVVTTAWIALLSLGLVGTVNFVFGGRARYADVFTVWFYASLPAIVKTLLGIVVIYAGIAPESFNIKNFAPTNVGAFLDPAATNKALYALATSLDAVTVWTLVLLSIGVAAAAAVKRSSGYIAVFGWWLIFVAIQVGWASFR